MQPLRTLDGDFDRADLRRARYMTLVLVGSESAWLACTISDKDALIAQWRREGGRLMMAWTGQYRSDVFELTNADVDAAFPPG